VLGKKIELISAITNKADTSANIAREWFDKEKVDAIFDLCRPIPARGDGSAEQKNRNHGRVGRRVAADHQ